MSKLEFWYDFASTYSYLSAMRIEALTAGNPEVVWRPFLLGPIFKAQGWNTSPFQIFPTKGRYMVRDLARIAADRGVTFRMPAVFPANGLQAARVALIGAQESWIGPFTRRVFEAEFAEGRDISDLSVLRSLVAELGLDADRIMQLCGDPEIKDALRRQTEHAASRGLFGAPSFLTADGELFWGDDRLEQAIAWARRI
jgi:2-hydroxychromene-2-carboxylate isomerase